MEMGLRVLLLSSLLVFAHSKSECIEQREGGLCLVDVTKHTFAAPNPLLPSAVRGVYWIDAGKGTGMLGKSNPYIDLNMLEPFAQHPRQSAAATVAKLTKTIRDVENEGAALHNAAHNFGVQRGAGTKPPKKQRSRR